MKGKEGEGLKISCDVVCFQGEQEFSFITSSIHCIISRKGQGMIVCHTDTTRLQDLVSCRAFISAFLLYRNIYL